MTPRSISGGGAALLLVLGLLLFGSVAGAELQPADISPTGANASRPLIATDGAGAIAALWRDFDNDSWSIRAAFRARGGEWSAKRISEPASSTESPALAMDGLGNVVAVWQRSNGPESVVQAAIRPAGGDWGAAQDISLPTEPSFDAEVDIKAGQVTVVWTALRDRRRVLRSSSRTASGTWAAPDLVAGPDGDPIEPVVALDDHGSAIVAWQEWDGANRRVTATARTPGHTWSAPELLSSPGRNTSRPRLVVDADGDALAGWIRPNGDWTVAQVASRSSAGAWGPPANLSNRSSDAAGIDLAISRGGHAVAVWKQGSLSSNLWSSSRAPDTTHWSGRSPITQWWVRLQADVAVDEEGNATAVWSSGGTVSASFKPIGKPWQDDYLLSHLDDHTFAPAVATQGPTVATAVWMRVSEEDDRIQSVSYDIDTSAKEAQEEEGDDEGEDEDDEGEEVMGTAHADRLVGTPGNDVFHGSGGNDTIMGRGGRDVVYGGPGDDRLLGGPGADRVFGGSGRDTILGGRGADVLVGGPGRDLLRGNSGNDTLRARDGRTDRIRGGRGLDAYWLDRWLDDATSIETRLR
jgi:hypothetical protein